MLEINKTVQLYFQTSKEIYIAERREYPCIIIISSFNF